VKDLLGPADAERWDRVQDFHNDNSKRRLTPRRKDAKQNNRFFFSKKAIRSLRLSAFA